MALQTSGLRTLRWNNTKRILALNVLAVLTEIFIWSFYVLALVLPVLLLLPEDYDAQKILVPIIMVPIILRAGIRTPITRLFVTHPQEALDSLQAKELKVGPSDQVLRVLEELSIQIAIKTPQIFEIPVLHTQITISSFRFKRKHYALLVSQVALDLPVNELRCLFAYELARIKSKDSDFQRDMLATFQSYDEFLKILKNVRGSLPAYAYPLYLLLLPLAFLLGVSAKIARRFHSAGTGIDQDFAGFEITKNVDATISLYRKVLQNPLFLSARFPVLEQLKPLFLGLVIEESDHNVFRDLQTRSHRLQKIIRKSPQR